MRQFSAYSTTICEDCHKEKPVDYFDSIEMDICEACWNKRQRNEPCDVCRDEKSVGYFECLELNLCESCWIDKNITCQCGTISSVEYLYLHGVCEDCYESVECAWCKQKCKEDEIVDGMCEDCRKPLKICVKKQKFSK